MVRAGHGDFDLAAELGRRVQHAGSDRAEQPLPTGGCQARNVALFGIDGQATQSLRRVDNQIDSTFFAKRPEPWQVGGESACELHVADGDHPSALGDDGFEFFKRPSASKTVRDGVGVGSIFLRDVGVGKENQFHAAAFGLNDPRVVVRRVFVDVADDLIAFFERIAVRDHRKSL